MKGGRLDLSLTWQVEHVRLWGEVTGLPLSEKVSTLLFLRSKGDRQVEAVEELIQSGGVHS